MKISFSSSTFDRIQKVTLRSKDSANPLDQDRAAKFVDHLSAIGGTMGFLTSFSLISGVEIVYFMVKIIASILGKK